MPINKEELKKRKWPLPNFPIGNEVIGRKEEKSGIVFYDDNGTQVIGKKGEYANLPYPSDYLESYKVQEGKVKIIPLGEKEITGSISPEECGITCLVKDSEGKIFGATSGRKSHLFMYNPKDKINYAIHLGVIEEKPCKINSLVISSDGYLFGGTELKNGGGYLFSYNTKEKFPKIEKISIPVKNEGISALTIDNNLSRIYGLSSKTGTFFIFYLEDGSLELKGQVDKEHIFSKVLVVGPKGDVFGGACWGQLFKYDVRKERLVPLKIKVPSIRGREMYNEIDSLIFDRKSNSIYGGTSADGILFQFYPDKEKIISLGKVINQSHIRCLAFGNNGYLYGIAGKNCCHLFKYNPKERDLREIGILYVTSPRYWHGYEFDAAITGENGEIYFGQNERISYLFVYSPL